MTAPGFMHYTTQDDVPAVIKTIDHVEHLIGQDIQPVDISGRRVIICT